MQWLKSVTMEKPVVQEVELWRVTKDNARAALCRPIPPSVCRLLDVRLGTNLRKKRKNYRPAELIRFFRYGVTTKQRFDPRPN
jgi:hypothetical protein